MRVIVLDGACFTSKAETHEYIAKMLGFPAYYGKNLDALDDSLHELPRDTGIIIVNAAAARCALSDYADGIFEDFFDVLGGRFRVCIFE